MCVSVTSVYRRACRTTDFDRRHPSVRRYIHMKRFMQSSVEIEHDPAATTTTTARVAANRLHESGRLEEVDGG